jgi:glycosyltransferase involved in cell wall biosynthesis
MKSYQRDRASFHLQNSAMNLSQKEASTEEIKISFIVPIYNAEESILDCLKSIIDQGMDDIEILCVDDFSSDSSAAMVHAESLKDPRIKLIRHETNRGAPTARNNAIKKAAGKYIAFVDADDELCRNSLCLLYRQAEKQ